MHIDGKSIIPLFTPDFDALIDTLEKYRDIHPDCELLIVQSKDKAKLLFGSLFAQQVATHIIINGDPDHLKGLRTLESVVEDLYDDVKSSEIN